MRPAGYLSMDSLSGSASSSGTSTPVPPHDVSNIPPVIEEVTVATSPPPAGDRDVREQSLINAREYQLEMFEESKNRNIIVAMDTGSGKTQVAVLRIQFELECSPDKMIWFLVPTVALCEQQSKVLRAQIPSAVIKVLNGKDGIDTWTSEALWDAFLENTHIVVSTYQVLQDALQHSFVRLKGLSLIVFDEAHNCTKNHPGVKIMMLYRKHKQAGLSLPKILGLTASPVIGTSMKDIERLESTLDAVCRTPIKHRGELLSQVKRPTTVHITYGSASSLGRRTEAMGSLSQVLRSFTDRIHEDPYIKRKALEGTERSFEDLRQAILKQDTPTIKQLRSLYRKTEHILHELGPWGADFFLHSAIVEYLNSVDRKDISYTGWNIVEKEYLANTLRLVQLPDLRFDSDIPISDKVAKLIQQLLTCQNITQGIIFLEETAVVHALQIILTTHHLTRGRFRFGAMIGTSRYAAKKRDVGELIRNDSHLELDKFRLGKLNFLIATSVLEEGIDVPACNLVISFNPPTNLRAFIQRRGRARMRESQLVLFWDTGNTMRKSWEKYEEEMKRKYEVEDREKRELDILEESEESHVPPLRTKIGAELDFDAAISHLQHFCDVMVSGQYVDKSPYYLIKRTGAMTSKPETSQIKATVVLPNFLPPHLHRINSPNVWYSEKNARKDAAFQAYKKLYEAGLVNDNLLPLLDNDLVQVPDIRTPTVEVDERWNPWPRIARAWSGSYRYHYGIKVIGRGRVLHDTEMILPVPLPHIPPFDIYWNSDPWKMEITPKPRIGTSGNEVNRPDQTMGLVKLAHGHRQVELREDAQLVVRFSTQDETITTKSFGAQPFHEHFTASRDEFPYLVRDGLSNRPYIYEEYLPSMPSLDSVKKKHSPSAERFIDQHGRDGPWLALRPWHHRREVLHKPSGPGPTSRCKSTQRYHTVWPSSCCSIDAARIADVRFGFMISSIIHILEVYLVADELAHATVLKELDFRDLSLVVTATSASSALEATDYERLEFFGDVLLKLISTISVAVQHPRYPEGYLTTTRAKMLSNSSLCHATLDAKLAKFIRTKVFSGRKWEPPYIDELVSADEVPGKREMSTKMLADVVESLTGAAFEDAPAGRKMDNALRCLRLLLPGAWHGLNEGRQALLLLPQSSTTLPSILEPLEALIGYKFRNKTLLIEAVTHASYQGGGPAATMSASADQTLERLEFIGDAILDYVVVQALWNHTTPLPQSAMSPLRAACVNKDLLGFLAMEWTVPRPTGAIGPAGLPVATAELFPFWAFMRYSHAEIGFVQQAAAARHARERGRIRDAMDASGGGGGVYPWVELAHLHPPKFFSDMVESVLGAVWLDSGGGDDDDDDDDPDGAAMRPCVAFAERLGVLPYLRRLLADGVDVIHPKNKVGMLADREKVRYEVVPYDDTGDHGGGAVPSSLSSPLGGERDGGEELAQGELDKDMEDLEMTDEIMIERQLYQEMEAARLRAVGATRWACRVFVGEELVVEMHGGLHKDEIITRAAERAYEVLRERKERQGRAKGRKQEHGRMQKQEEEQGDQEELDHGGGVMLAIS